VVRDTFQDEHTRAFMLWMSFMTVQPVDRPGTGPLAYSLVYGRQRHSWTLPRGGSGALPAALARLVEAGGGEIVCGAPVTGLVVRGGRCVGVDTADGRRHLAGRAVLSTIHVKQLLQMAPASAWDDDFRYGVDTWRAGVSMFVAHYATTQPPRFPTGGGEVAAVASGTPHSVDRLLRVGADHTRGIVVTDEPVLLVLAPTVATRLVNRMRVPAEEALTSREIEVLELVARGSSNADVAASLFISEATVKTHLLHIFGKLGVDDRTAAVVSALERGIIALSRRKA
jgi:DNA-binding CsgD family transcriptional regulator